MRMRDEPVAAAATASCVSSRRRTRRRSGTSGRNLSSVESAIERSSNAWRPWRRDSSTLHPGEPGPPKRAVRCGWAIGDSDRACFATDEERVHEVEARQPRDVRRDRGRVDPGVLPQEPLPRASDHRLFSTQLRNQPLLEPASGDEVFRRRHVSVPGASSRRRCPTWRNSRVAPGWAPHCRNSTLHRSCSAQPCGVGAMALP
jgi:hypothetical protein